MKLRVTAAAESIVRSGHPWLFAGSIHEQNRAGQPGELAVIYDRNNRFLAIGLFDPDSPLRVRILHRGKPATIDEAWFRRRLQSALDLRDGMFDHHTSGYRCVHGESDGWPGLVIDRYGQSFVLKLYTAAWLPHLGMVTALVRDLLQPGRLVLRLSRNIQPFAQQQFGLHDGGLLFGPPLAADGLATFVETGIQFAADVLRGQKTGFFLDQRENRRRVEKLARDADVLNAFSFSGGFSIYAARGGARSVTDLDISAHALEAGRRNFELNTHDENIRRCKRESVQADVFEWLAAPAPRVGRQFDIVILDPPSLARRESERPGALHAYARLAASGIRMIRRGGLLVAASCSAHVSRDEFFGVIRSEARKSGRVFKELETVGHPPDHPASFPEAEYLKCIYLRLD